MTVEQATIHDYHKGLVDVGICADVLLTSIKPTYPTLCTFLLSVLDEDSVYDIVDALEEIINHDAAANSI